MGWQRHYLCVSDSFVVLIFKIPDTLPESQYDRYTLKPSMLKICYVFTNLQKSMSHKVLFFSISYFLIYYNLVKSLSKNLKLRIFTLVIKVLIGQKINFSYHLRILSHKVRGKHSDIFMCYIASFYIINN